MTDLIIPGNGPLTMSSREIADLVGSRHDDVKRSIERLSSDQFSDDGSVKRPAVIVRPPLADEQSTDAMGRARTTQVYIFSGAQGKRDSIIVVAQLSPEFTARLVDRWQELEAKVSGPTAVPQSLPEALRMAADLAEKAEALQVERDEAVRTKAQIGSKREATAMATAAKASREAERLRGELGRNQHHATIIAVEQVAGVKFERNAYVPLRRWCKQRGVKPVEVMDERYGMVKAWPAGAWMDCHDVDLAGLFGRPA